MARPYRSHRRGRQRRGVVLLVVLSLLVLLVIVAMMFAIAAGQYQRSAEVMSQSELAQEDPITLLDSAMYQVLRDTNTNRSVLRGHSLLRDMYGDDFFTGTISSARYAGADQNDHLGTTDGQLIDLSLQASSGLSSLVDFYAGRVLTITSNNTTGVISTRVISYTPASPGPPATPAILRVLAFPDKNGQPLQPDSNGILTALASTEFRLNGGAFNGTGFAYDPSTGKLDLESLYPNRIADVATAFNNYLNGLSGAGGSDESYDAADFQNIALAAVIPASDAPGALVDVIPTGHRPALIGYHRANNSAAWDPSNLSSFNSPSSKDERRKVILRPMPWDHPNFTGSNPAMAGGNYSDILNKLEQNGPWDVDNDGEGTRDSIWLDLGFPVQRSGDGRAYKPLFAILCLDLDGRVNVNAHGDAGHYQDPTPVDVAPRKLNTPNPLTKSDSLGRRGQGYGPPEVNLRRLFDVNNTAADYRALVEGRYRSSISGNPDNLPGQTGLEVKSAYKFFEFPDNYFTSPTRSSYFSPPDLWGQLAFGLDYRGQPIFESPTMANAKADSPYELALVNEGVDVQYSIAELERLLRVYDLDASQLPARLHTRLTALNPTNLFDPVNANGQRRVTTHSFDVPVPNISLPPDLQSLFATSRPRHVTELFRARMQGNTLPQTLAEALVAPELLRGERFDVNRPFGNGMDDNGNFVVDEHGHDATFQSVLEAAGTEQWFPSSPTNPTFLNNPPLSTATIDHDNDGVFANDPDAFLARYHYARHLYMLMMVLADNDAAGQKSPAMARQIAQWAVNVVDFRDADSIMTAFEYDQNPFNGWHVNGVLNTSDLDHTHPDRAVVWGCERPELLITEALTFHDKRTRNVPNIPSTNEQQDPHLDQGERPQGSTFIELYNPWAGVNEMRPAEFYWNNGFVNGVLLNKRAPDGTPIWRIIVIKDPQKKGLDPNDPNSNFQPSDIDRRIYFVNPPAGAPAAGDYYTNQTVAPVAPGGYAVIGSPGQAVNNTFTTVVSRRRDADPNARRVILRPGINPNPAAVDVRDNIRDSIGVIPPEPGVADLPPAVAVVIDAPALNVSEPVGGYNLIPPLDEPFDLTNAELDDPTGLDEKTLIDFCEFQLQRLANPLLPQDDVTNPYITIDSMPTDLTLYNGVSDDQPPMPPQQQNQQEYVRFYSRQRGDRDAQYPPDPNQAWQPFATYLRFLWPYEPAQPFSQPPTNSQQESPPAGHLGHFFEYTLKHSLGYLNHNYWPYYDTASSPTPFYLGGPNSDIAANGNTMGPPFPWLTWNNRPFVSHLELLQVPRSSAFDLLRHFTTAPPANPPSPYDPANGALFRHMLNFFESSPPQNAADFYRLFDYVHVPSRFVGTQLTFDPIVFRPNVFGTERLHPPFNQVSTFREPGRVNVNTIYSANVWGAIMDGHGGPSWPALIASRRGYTPTGPATNPITTRNSSVPTTFANPFRATGAGELVPLTSMERVGTECMLLRSDAVDQASSPGNEPLFQSTFITKSLDHSNTNRNSYFRFEGLQRLSNILSTRSNVYAVWITVGYFEVEPVQNVATTKYPYDGYTLGREVGELTGQVKRHRGFYVIDRSVPVGFSPGDNLNVDHAILLRRFIE